MKRIAVLSLAALAGCSYVNAVMHPVSPQEVAAIEVALTAAENLASNYTKLTPCGTPGVTAICADPTLKAKIKNDDNVAYSAVQTLKTSSASGAPAALSAAQAAISAFNADVPVTVSK